MAEEDFDLEAYIEAPYNEAARKRERDEADRDRDHDRDRKRSRDDDRRSSRDDRDHRDRDHRSSRDSDRHRSSRRRTPSPERAARRRAREEAEAAEEARREAEREKEDIDRESRTVFVCNLPRSADRRKIFEFFEQHAGKVNDVKLICDRARKSKGIGYVEFTEVATVPKAIALTGTMFNRYTIEVKLTEAEKNRQAQAAATPAHVVMGPTKLYVGSLHHGITEDDLRLIFGPFGEISSISLQMEAPGRNKGFGFVEFRRADEARRAMQQLNDMELADRRIRVEIVHDPLSDNIVGPDLDDDEGGGMALNAQSRAMLMAKLQHQQPIAPASRVVLPGSAPVSMANPIGWIPPAPLIPTPPPPLPSHCVLLKNMFDPANETNPDFAADIKEDVEDECSKFGPILHIFVDKASAGYVYLKFAEIPSAQKCISGLNGRWFASKMITAEFFPEASYRAKFPSV